MKKILNKLVLGGLVAANLLPLKSDARLSITNNQTFVTNSVNYESDLWIRNTSDIAEPYFQMDISTDLAGRGCENIASKWKQWQYETTGEDSSTMTTNYLGWVIAPGAQEIFHYTIPTNSVVGWQTVQAEMVAPAGTVPFDYIVPITPTTTTSNGTSVAVLHGAGFNSTNTMAYFESSSVQNSDSDSMTDVQEWVAGTDKFVADGLEGVINQTTNGVEVSASPNVAERIYDIHSSTNLVEGVGFEKIGSYTNNVGETEGKFLDERDLDAASYKVEVALP